MTDPLDALRQPIDPVAPDRRFAAELLDKLRRAVLNSDDEMGEDMSTTTTTTTAEPGALTPYIAVSDARAALDFYVEVFDAERRADPIVMADGRIGHAELAIGGSVLMLSDEFADIGHTGGGSVRVEVADPDRAVARAAQLGAEVIRPVTASPYGRGGTIRDPFGQRWLVAEAPRRTADAPPVRHGQAGYFTFQVPAAEPAKEFYGAVLGWQFSPGTVEGSWRVAGSGLHGGLWGGPGRQVGWKIMYAVDDLSAALDQVRAHGGQAGEPEQYPYGLTADCVDNQGIEFWLWEQNAGA
jgi:uncharacterized glyoxalase superfamily protein PhnB